jgi:hypothetical protein
MGSLPRAVRHAPLRLAIVVLLSFLVTGVFYGVSLTPVGQSMVSARGGPPAGRGPNAAAKPSTTAPADPAASATTSADPAASTAAPAQAAPAGRPGGGGRPASLARGLPELARNAGVIAVLIVIVAAVQAGLRYRRRPQARRLLA